MENIIIYGAGGHAKACIDVVISEGKYHPCAVVGLSSQIGSSICGVKIVCDDSGLMELQKLSRNIVIGIGQIKEPNRRKLLYFELLKKGFLLPSIYSKMSYISKDAKVGNGTIVMHGAIINSDAVIGDNCIINSKALIEHDVKIENHCHISTGSILNGGVNIGESSFVGSGTQIKQGVSVGKNCVISIGSTVIKNCLDDTIFYG